MKLRQILKRSLGVCFDFDGNKFVSSGDLLFVKYFIHKLSRYEFIQLRKCQRGVFQNHVVCSPSPLRPSVLRAPQFLRHQKAKNALNWWKNLRKRLLRRLKPSWLTDFHLAQTKRIVLFLAQSAQKDNKCYERFTSKRENVPVKGCLHSSLEPEPCDRGAIFFACYLGLKLDINAPINSKLQHPPRAYPGHLTVHRARGGGNLNVALKGWGI